MNSMARILKKKVAVVQCTGGCRRQTEICREAGDGCQQILAVKEEAMSCKYGCLGGGSCVDACRFHAVYINARGVAEVDPEKCTGCGLCAKACPRNLIRITTAEWNIYPACVSEDAGTQTRNNCETGCIACGICVRNCPMGAVTIENNYAVIDEDKCIACGMCAVKCPRGVIRDYNGIFTIQEAQVKQ